eukprot:gene491-biopygen21145
MARTWHGMSCDPWPVVWRVRQKVVLYAPALLGVRVGEAAVPGPPKKRGRPPAQPRAAPAPAEKKEREPPKNKRSEQKALHPFSSMPRRRTSGTPCRGGR